MVAENRIPPPLPLAIIPAIALPPATADKQLPPPSRPAPLPLPLPLPLETAATASEPPTPLPAEIQSPAVPVPESPDAAFSEKHGYQRLRLPAVTRTIARDFRLMASCVDGGCPDNYRRVPPPQGCRMQYAADSVYVKRIVPVPTATMPLSAATRLGMISLLGTGSPEHVKVDCPPGETWVLTVRDGLGLIGTENDLQVALTAYRKPEIEKALLEMDAVEDELRCFLPGQVFLLSLFAAVRADISWMLPTADDPQGVKQTYLQRFCHMLFADPLADKIFRWFNDELALIEGPALAGSVKQLLQGTQYLPSETSLQNSVSHSQTGFQSNRCSMNASPLCRENTR